ncbi:uncharacterized protein LOC132047524 [Lycium ferocissimum]|uniref:uncharacterized protein LOC132047524 n=1 Tax=Lycium ferocissimum TaxID=112874 RepID=UPI0028156C48|nr:uncharacterized protein LOC132047524 [Lycium ferocissimum]
MEGVTTRVYSGLKGYWRRRGYQKLNKTNRVELSAEGSTRKRRFWKIKLTRKLKLKINFKRFSLKKLLIGLRDAYVNTMLRIANTREFGGGSIDGFGMRPSKEYDERVLVEIYKSMIIAQGKLGNRVGAATAKIGPENTTSTTTTSV